MTVTGHTYTSTRARGLAEWNPNAATLVVLHQIGQVLREYRAYLPLTARQVFYRLVGNHGYDKTEKAYKRLLEYLNRARRAGMIPWGALRDDGFTAAGGGGWNGPAEVVQAWADDANDYQRNRLQGQPAIELWVEAAGMIPQATTATQGYHVPVYSSGGFNSVTAKYQTARRVVNHWSAYRSTIILHVGDYDPSGVAIIDSLADDIQQFVRDMGRPGPAVLFERIAVTPTQIDDLGLPGAPPKRNDRRGDFYDLAVQAESIPPDQLQVIMREAVEAHIDRDVLDELLERSDRERDALVDVVAEIPDLEMDD